MDEIILAVSVEQSLDAKTNQGIVVVTGCARTGLVKIFEDVKSPFGGPTRMVLGGFHLGHDHVGSITSIADAFRRLGIEKVAPCHCIGDRGKKLFTNENSENFIRIGVGKVIHVGD